MKRYRINALHPTASQLMPDVFGERQITGGGIYVFAPGEIAHPEERHVHDVDEVFLFLQGKGVLPVNGTEHPVETGDVVVVEAGEDHHTRSSVDDPLVAAWYLVEQESPAVEQLSPFAHR